MFRFLDVRGLGLLQTYMAGGWTSKAVCKALVALLAEMLMLYLDSLCHEACSMGLLGQGQNIWF